MRKFFACSLALTLFLTQICPSSMEGAFSPVSDSEKPLLIHIQTSHRQYETQKQIQILLPSLLNKYGINLILLEGAAHELQPGIFKLIPEEPALNSKILDALVRKGNLTGAEAFLTESGAKVKAWGVEEIDSYRKNWEAYQKVIQNRSQVNFKQERLEKEILARSGGPLIDFIRNKINFESKTLSFQSWLDFLGREAQKHLGIDWNRSKAHSDWPWLSRYFRNRSILPVGKFNPDRFFEESEALEEKIIKSLAKTRDEKEVLKRYQEFRLLSKLNRLELTREEWENIKFKVRGLRVETFPPKADPPPAENLEPALDFYQAAVAREDWIVKNSIRRMRDSKQKRAILITGGFHALEIKKSIEHAGFHYLAIKPNVWQESSSIAGLEPPLVEDPELIAALNDQGLIQAIRQSVMDSAREIISQVRPWQAEFFLSRIRHSLFFGRSYQANSLGENSHSVKTGLIPVEDNAEMVQEVVNRLLQAVPRILEAKSGNGNDPVAVLGLATGGTMEAVYRELVRRYEKDSAINFSQVVSFNLDEYRGLAPHHEQSYREYMERHLFRPLRAIDSRRMFRETYVLDGSAQNSGEAIQAFVKKINQYGGIDWQLLGIGSDGHFAFVEPAVFISRAKLRESENGLTGKIRDFNEFILEDGLEDEELAGMIAKILEMRTRVRSRLAAESELFNRLVAAQKKRAPETDFQEGTHWGDRMRDELESFAKRLMINGETVFYLSDAGQNRIEKIFALLSERQETALVLERIKIRNRNEFFETPAREVNLAIPTLLDNSRCFETLRDVPLRALTLSGLVLEAREIVLAASGPEKRDAVQRSMSEPVTPELPASVLQDHSSVLMIADRAALGSLALRNRVQAIHQRFLLDQRRFDAPWNAQAGSLGELENQESQWVFELDLKSRRKLLMAA